MHTMYKYNVWVLCWRTSCCSVRNFCKEQKAWHFPFSSTFHLFDPCEKFPMWLCKYECTRMNFSRKFRQTDRVTGKKVWRLKCNCRLMCQVVWLFYFTLWHAVLFSHFIFTPSRCNFWNYSWCKYIVHVRVCIHESEGNTFSVRLLTTQRSWCWWPCHSKMNFEKLNGEKGAFPFQMNEFSFAMWCEKLLQLFS